MTHSTITTYPLSETDSTITLTAYIAAVGSELPYNEKRRGVLVCPGGGYSFVSDREGDPIALAFLKNGYNAFVLTYTVNNKNHPGKPFPTQLLEAAAAMKFIRERADEFHVNPDEIFVTGYSAGGHLAASLGTLYNCDCIKNAFPGMPENFARPLGMILAYPVITSGEKTHRGTMESLLLDRRDDPAARAEVSLEKRVTKDTVPAFVWHTRTDTTVPVENSLLLCSALAENGIGFELHIFPYGGHGASLADPTVGWDNPTIAAWFNEALRWMKTISPKETN